MSKALLLQQSKAESQQRNAQPGRQPVSQLATEFDDHRVHTIAQRQVQEIANHSPRAQQLKAMHQMMQNSPQSAQLRALQAMTNKTVLQRVDDDEDDVPRQAKLTNTRPVQLLSQPVIQPNNTGLPNQLKAGIESLSGMSMDHVKVSYNSAKPAQLNAHAYAQGSEIHIAPGQEQHLPHEAWHVVQQAQGRVQPTMQMKVGAPVNGDVGLETEADMMGALASNITAAVHPIADARRPTSDSIQRKVIVGGKPASMVSRNSTFLNGEHIELGSRSAEWVTDGYRRDYKTNQEFKSHLQGAPVDVGLSKKLGRWYRLPFFSAGRFFVLGENHGAFGYRELIRESNQPGKVLGEGGANTVMSATDTSPLQANPNGLKDTGGHSRESMMENVAAKAYFGLTILRANCVKMIKPGAAAGSGPIRLPEAEWLRNYQSATPDKRKVGTGLDKVPYYEDPSGKPVVATFGTHAENYNPIDTAFRVVQDLHDGIAGHVGVANQNMQNIQAGILAARNLKDAPVVNYQGMIDQIDLLFPMVQTLAFAEATQLNGGVSPNPDLKIRLTEVEKNLPTYKERRKKSFAHRDYVMYKSVLKARGDHVMAGMGDNHAKNLKGALETDHRIPVVLFSEFITSPYSIDAIAPMAEVPGFDKAVEESEQDRDKFLMTIYEKLIRQLPEQSAPMPLMTISSLSALPPPTINLLKHVWQSPLYRQRQLIEPRFRQQFAMSASMMQEVSSPDALTLASPARDSKPASARVGGVTKFKAPQLLKLREAMEGFFFLPNHEHAAGSKALTVSKKGTGDGISLARVFDQFLALGGLLETVNFNMNATLHESLLSLLEQINAKHDQQALMDPQTSRLLQSTISVAGILNSSGLGQMTIRSLLELIKNRTDK